MNLYVIRHGETDLNVKHKINGQNNKGLNQKGITEATLAGKKIKNLDLNLIICSPLKRAIQTCECLNKENIPVIYDNRIMERDSGAMEYESDSILDLNIWYDIEKEVVYRDSEGFKSVFDRVKLFLDEIKVKYNNQNILLVTHGDVCKAIMKYFDSNKDVKNREQKNCEIIYYEF